MPGRGRVLLIGACFLLGAAGARGQGRGAAPTGKAVPLPDVATDIDRRPRGAAPDVGAHEFRPPR